MKYWEVIADNLSKAGWSWGCISAVDARGRTIWMADAPRDGKRYVQADEKLTLFVELGNGDSASRELGYCEIRLDRLESFFVESNRLSDRLSNCQLSTSSRSWWFPTELGSDEKLGG